MTGQQKRGCGDMGRGVGVVDLCCFVAGGYAAYRD